MNQWLLVLALGLCVSCRGPIDCFDHAWTRVNTGKTTSCKQLRFPEPWRPEPTSVSQYSARRLRSGGEDFLLVALAGPDSVVTSQNKFKVPLSRLDQVATASQDEWQRGQEFVKWTDGADWFETEVGQRLLEPNSRQRFPLKGKHYWGALQSPTEKWLAIRSLDGRLPERRGTLFNFDRSEGDHYVEVFESATGRRVLRLPGQFCQIDPYSIWSGPGGWIDDNTLLLTYSISEPPGPVVCRLL